MQTVAENFQSQSSPESVSLSNLSKLMPSRRALVFLFLALMALYTYAAPRWNDWNQNSRLNLVRAIAERGTVQIDAFQDNTGDYAFYQGHYYSDKPPGPALAGAIPYIALKAVLDSPPVAPLVDKLAQSPSFSKMFTEGTNYGASEITPRDKLIGAIGRISLSVLLVSLPVALMACCFWVWACRLIGNYWLSLTLTLALALGTTLFPYSSLFYNHALTAALLYISFFLLFNQKGQDGKVSTGRLVLVGFLLGFSLISQYETVLIAGPLGLYALMTSGAGQWLKRVLWLVLGALPPLVAMVIYDLVAFGTPAPIGYQYSTLWLDKHSQGFMSLTYPHLDALWGLSFSPYRGLFLLSPFLLLALPGFYFGLRERRYWPVAGLALWSSVAFFLFNASSVMWWGGHTFGPRYLISCLPFMAMGVAFMLRKAVAQTWRFNWLWFGLPAAVSILIVLPASLVGRQWPTEELSSPLTDYLWPELFSGNFALNPGSVLGLKGLLSYVPLVVIVGGLYLGLFHWPGRNRRGTGGAKALSLEVESQRFSSVVEAGPTEVEIIPPTLSKTAVWWRSDKSFVGFTLAALLVFTSLPYLFGYLRAPKDKTFMGIMLDVPDTTQYWAWMHEMQRNWLISNPLTPEANDPVFFNPLWGLLGRWQALTGWSSEWIYQGFRVFSLVFFGLMAWGFCRFIFTKPLTRRVAFFLIMFGSGWGWVSILIKQFTGTLSNPLSVFVAEPNTFQSALAFPHLFFSAGLILAVFQLAFKAAETGRLKWAGIAGLIALGLGLEHAYDLIIVYGVLGIYWLAGMARTRRIDWPWFKILLVIGLISFGPPVYFGYITTVNPTWKGVLAQYGNAGVFTPDPLNLLLLIGPLMLVAIAGLWAKPVAEAGNHSVERWRFMKVWFVVGFCLLYIPTNFQIKMLNGWQIPVFGLAVMALDGPLLNWLRLRLTPRFRIKRLQLVLFALAIAVALPTTVYIFSWRFVDLNRTAQPYYLQKDEVAAIDWIGANSPSGVVLSSEDLGQYLAARTSDRPFLAHWAMTLDFYTKRKLSAEVLDPATTSERRAAILKEYQVKYILYGAAEKRQASELAGPNLKKVFTTPTADVYLVTN